jgi:hypothetical protein
MGDSSSRKHQDAKEEAGAGIFSGMGTLMAPVHAGIPEEIVIPRKVIRNIHHFAAAGGPVTIFYKNQA